jgi:DNA polymerase epsilon subunit 1
LDKFLNYVIEGVAGMKKGEVVNYDQVKMDISQKLIDLKNNPLRKEKPSIYHLDVAAMYPNIILTNRLQPTAIVNDEICAACNYNLPENNWYFFLKKI